MTKRTTGSLALLPTQSGQEVVFKHWKFGGRVKNKSRAVWGARASSSQTPHGGVFLKPRPSYPEVLGCNSLMPSGQPPGFDSGGHSKKCEHDRHGWIQRQEFDGPLSQAPRVGVQCCQLQAPFQL